MIIRVCFRGFRTGLCFCILLFGAACSRQSPAPIQYNEVVSSLPQKFYSPKREAARSVVVSQGDTVWGISHRFDIPVRALITANLLESPFILQVGQHLKLPVLVEYRVRKGDTLHGISRRFGVDLGNLIQINRVEAPYKIKEGQILTLPKLKNLKSRGKAQVGNVAKTQSSTPFNKSKKIYPFDESLFLWPVTGRVVQGYGPQGDGRYNAGLNIKAGQGQPVLAARAGVIVYVGSDLKGLGNLVLIRHEGGWITAYAHNEVILVRKGDVVNQGHIISRVGKTGSARFPQLHFEIRKGTQTVNPSHYLQGSISINKKLGPSGVRLNLG